jgi:macrodomain Ter protein organizer (MatP/YcbG family)
MKKLIDLDEQTFKALSHQAVDAKMNLKKYIEKILTDKAKKNGKL